MPVHTVPELLGRIRSRNDTTRVSVSKIPLKECRPWGYDPASGEIRNPDGAFFRIRGLSADVGGRHIGQPIIIQDEIGYLGIIRKRIGGEMHYLMQAKIEPGNVNQVQISPTVQATKSNFTRKHGGKAPAYLDYFAGEVRGRVIADQIQSEQSSRFLGKRNRNIIIELDEREEVEVLPTHMWMTLGQIRRLMREDNLVNMDTRTVLSCLPPGEHLEDISDPAMRRSAFGEGDGNPVRIYRYINDYKMFHTGGRSLVPLLSLEGWEMRGDEFVCARPYGFKVIFCDIEIEGREVRRWRQPLFEATGPSTFGLITRVHEGVTEFLVKAVPEVGCFDRIEIGPSVQRECAGGAEEKTEVDALFDTRLKSGEGVRFDVMLSEEGGRFYHEQNRNVIMEIGEDELAYLPEGYFWTDYRTLGTLLRVNNCLNIQLRNLLSALEW